MTQTETPSNWCAMDEAILDKLANQQARNPGNEDND